MPYSQLRKMVDLPLMDEVASFEQESLYDHLKQQLPSHYDAKRLKKWVDLIDANGYLPKQTVIDSQEQAFLAQLDPVGCFCFSLAQCLRTQCQCSNEPASLIAERLCDQLEEVANQNWTGLAQSLNLSLEEIHAGVDFLLTCQPKPAAYYHREPALEVVASYEAGQLSLNNYFVVENDQDDPLLRMLQARNETLLKVLQALVSIQKGYLDNQQPLQRCTMAEIAHSCGLHPSTITRMVAHRAILVNQKQLPLKKLFVRSSMEQVMDLIEQWIKQENPLKPLSDDDLVQKLSLEGFFVARRTVGSYRQRLGILNYRKRRSI